MRHNLLQLENRLRSPHASDDIFALGVDEKLAVKLVRAVRRIAGKGHARTGIRAGVAVNHCLHVYCRAPLLRDVVFPPVNDRAVVHPRAENRAGRAAQLIPRIVRKRVAGPLFHQLLETLHQFLVIGCVELRIFEIVAAVLLVFVMLDHGLERIVIFALALLHAHDDVAVHLDETAVTIPRKTLVIGRLHQRLHGLIVQAEVQDRVHHARHRIARAGADRDEQRHLRGVAELRAHDPLHVRDAFFHLGLEGRRVALLVRVVVSADFGRDRESRRHRQTDPCHLREVRAFAPEERLHAPVAIGFPVAEEVNVPRGFALRLGGFCGLRTGLNRSSRGSF